MTFLVAWKNNRHLATLPLVSRPNDVWETSAKIPYWWRVTTQIWVVLVVVVLCGKFDSTNQKYYPDKKRVYCTRSANTNTQNLYPLIDSAWNAFIRNSLFLNTQVLVPCNFTEQRCIPLLWCAFLHYLPCSRLKLRFHTCWCHRGLLQYQTRFWSHR